MLDLPDGAEGQVDFTWSIDRFWQLHALYAHIFAGQYIRDAGGRSFDYYRLQLTPAASSSPTPVLPFLRRSPPRSAVTIAARNRDRGAGCGEGAFP